MGILKVMSLFKKKMLNISYLQIFNYPDVTQLFILAASSN